MFRNAWILAVAAAVLFATPVFALSASEKMKTCKFGADDQKLTGKARADFMKKCMANEDAGPKSAKPAAPEPAQ